MISAAPVQRHLPLNDPRLRSLLLSWPAVRAEFPSASDDEIRSWLGLELPWSFNLGAGECREFICVLTEAVLERKKFLGDPQFRPGTPRWSVEQAINAALPKNPMLRSSTLARAWNVSPDQMDVLISSGELKIIDRNYQPKEARQIARVCAEQFLRRRIS